MPATEWGWLIHPNELQTWILENNDRLLVVNKPPHVVCNPSRHGPWSSLIGACREFLGIERLHMPSRLDRETSGVMVFAKDAATGRRFQHAVLQGRTCKTYITVVCGELDRAITVDQPLGRDPGAQFFSRQWVVEGGRPAVTEFVPLLYRNGYTVLRAHPKTGRRHQVRVHASCMGHPLVSDKLYGRDPALMLELIRCGFSEESLSALPLRRHALHALEVSYDGATFRAPVACDIIDFCRTEMGLTRDDIPRCWYPSPIS